MSNPPTHPPVDNSIN